MGSWTAQLLLKRMDSFIFRNSLHLTALIETFSTWKTTTGVAFPADVAITCDANTGGNATLIEVVYNIYRKGISLIALDPNYKSPIGG
ncbi:hypothetical protein PRIPAC_85567 [Pristionchus pacificus]|uniref:Uncharacterized protein n=1 Tax=Pristionchus pacificus TaxID=54126 RepID=A0A2A6BS88_PRIPA|nr:hypothetical protein PRIPAC_85567 [Pristionchus pacificus]|eukprot:PDM68686.1 hypothetical protein PRIPAC_46988 [Pristionchus pacificus]